MATRFTNPFPRFFNDNAALLAAGKLTFWEAGSTTTKKDTFTDSTLGTANANPVILSKGGVVPDIWLDGTYRITLENSDDGSIDETDNVGEVSDTTFSNWSSSVTYGDGGNNIVTGSDGLYYVSIQASNLGNDPTTAAAFWTQITFIRVWNTNETYAVDVIVRGSDGNLYKALVSQAGNDPLTDETNWQNVKSSKYDAGVNYFIGDVAQDTDNEYYMSISDTNTGNDPSGTAAKWTRVRFIKTWNTNETYVIGDVVQETTGLMWRSLTNGNAGNTPNSSPTEWTPVVVAASSALVFISAASASASATVDITLPGGYDEYEVHILDLIPATDGALSWFRSSTDGGSTFDAGASDYNYTVVSAGTAVGSAAAAQIALTGTVGTGSTTGEVMSARIRIMQPASAALFTGIIWDAGNVNTSAAVVAHNGYGHRSAAEDVDAIRILMDSGNITSGLFALYGVNRA